MTAFPQKALPQAGEPPKVEKINVPAFNTKRLLPTRHKTKNAILSINSSGEVIIEFIKNKPKYRDERVTDVCRISQDGMRIAIYQPDPGRYYILHIAYY